MNKILILKIFLTVVTLLLGCVFNKYYAQTMDSNDCYLDRRCEDYTGWTNLIVVIVYGPEFYFDFTLEASSVDYTDETEDDPYGAANIEDFNAVGLSPYDQHVRIYGPYPSCQDLCKGQGYGMTELGMNNAMQIFPPITNVCNNSQTETFQTHLISSNDVQWPQNINYPVSFVLSFDGPSDFGANIIGHFEGVACDWPVAENSESSPYSVCENNYALPNTDGAFQQVSIDVNNSGENEYWFSITANANEISENANLVIRTPDLPGYNACEFELVKWQVYDVFEQCEIPCDLIANGQIENPLMHIQEINGYGATILDYTVPELEHPREFLVKLIINSGCGPCKLNLEYSLTDGLNTMPVSFNYSPACEDCLPTTELQPEKPYVLSLWVKEEDDNDGVNDLEPWSQTFYEPGIKIIMNPGTTEEVVVGPVYPTTPSTAEVQVYASPIIEGWQLLEITFTTPEEMSGFSLEFLAEDGPCYFDDIRMFPKDGSMKSYVYDPQNLRFVAELDERHFATLYEYDEEGRLMRVKKETERGIMTIQESKTSTVKRNN
jgi:hypothetical protein